MTRLALRTIDPLFVDPWRLARTLFEPAAKSNEPVDFSPRFDVTETDAAYVFAADLPGVDKDDLEVTLEGHTLTIAGQRLRKAPTDDAEKPAQAHLRERAWGRFQRTFRLPKTADGDAIAADLRDGVLTVTVAKKAEIKPRRVPIQNAEPLAS